MPPHVPESAEEAAIEQWKIRRLIKSLNNARGNGTSMISLIIPHKDEICRYSKMLQEEYGTASNIKSRVNRLSVLSAIQSTQQRLKLYNRTPPNGLLVYCGTVINDDGKEKKVTIDIEPFKPINTSLYLCDNKFHTECLNELLQDDDKFGFIVMDGNGALYGTLQGSHRDILQKFSVDLPKKHGRGGQSALRFARLRLEKRHNYVRKVAELGTHHFITNDRPNITGLVLAGSADFKTELERSDLFDPRLAAVLVKMVDVSYGGENGFNQAIELAGDTLKDVKLVQEKKLIARFFEEVAMDTGKICFGVEESLKALDMAAVETVIIWEALEVQRIVLVNPNTGEEKILLLRPEQMKEDKHFKDKETQVDLDVKQKMALTEWLVENYKLFGAKLEFITDKSQEGAQFIQGFGGIGGLMRYKVEFDELEGIYDEFGEDSDQDFM